MENINFQGHCIGFQDFRGKNNKFQGPQGQLFKIKAFQDFQGLLATIQKSLRLLNSQVQLQRYRKSHIFHCFVI